jgi:hypothetical protein
LAEREGFEPPVPFPVLQFSRLVHSAALPPLQVYIKCFLRKVLPDPDLRYFSKLKAVCLFLKAKYVLNDTGNLSFVAGTIFFL